MRKEHNEADAVSQLRKKHDILSIENRSIKMLIGDKAVNDIGNKSWGKIDYLIHYCGYSLIRCNE